MPVLQSIHLFVGLLVPEALLCAHAEGELTARHNLLVCYVVACKRLAVELDTLHVACLLAVALAYNLEDAALNIYLGTCHKRHTDNILARSR